MSSVDQPSRRTILKRAGVGGAAVVWAVPVVQSVAMPAASAAGSDQPGGGTNVGDLEGVVFEVVNGEWVYVLGATATLNDGSGRTATSGDGGVFGFSGVAAGPQSVTVTEIHYVPRTLTGVVLAGGFVSIDFMMTQVPHIEAVLTWGEHAWDMDLHLSGPDGDGGRFHVKPFVPETTDFAHMVLTDEDTDGPEKISVTLSSSHGDMFVPGSYHLWVHNVSHNVLGYPDFVTTESSVTLLGKAGAEGTFGPGTASGDPEDEIWLVCTFDLDTDGNVSNLSQAGGYNAFVPGTFDSVF